MMRIFSCENIIGFSNFTRFVASDQIKIATMMVWYIVKLFDIEKV
jgi:hypothetical protein